jgi:hypothetical protein
MTSNGFDTSFISKCDRLSIHSSFSLGPRHHTIPQNQRNSLLAERKQIADRGLFCRIHLKKPSFRRTDSSPSWTHKSDSLPYQIFVLTVVFDCLRANGVKLNPEKCVFGVPRGMLLGYIVS